MRIETGLRPSNSRALRNVNDKRAYPNSSDVLPLGISEPFGDLFLLIKTPISRQTYLYILSGGKFSDHIKAGVATR